MQNGALDFLTFAEATKLNVQCVEALLTSVLLFKNRFGSRAHPWEFSVASTPLDGTRRPGLARPVLCRVHGRHTRTTYSGRLASTWRWCWTQSGTTSASQPTRPGCHVWRLRLHLLHRSRGRRDHPGRARFSLTEPVGCHRVRKGTPQSTPLKGQGKARRGCKGKWKGAPFPKCGSGRWR